jgi:hypothetical protein
MKSATHIQQLFYKRSFHKQNISYIVAAPVAIVAAAGLVGMVASYYLIRLAKDGWENDKKRLKYVKELKEKISGFEELVSRSDEKDSKAKLAGVHVLLLKLDVITHIERLQLPEKLI